MAAREVGMEVALEAGGFKLKVCTHSPVCLEYT